MSRLANSFLCCAIITLSPVADSQAAARESSFISKKHGFAATIPSNWHVAAGESDLPLFVNFPWSQLQAQGTLPKGGATIHIQAEADLPEKHRDYSLDDWSAFDERTAVPGTVISRSFEMPHRTGVGRAIIVSFDEATFSSSIQQQHDVTVYWEFRGSRFATRLNCIASDPKCREFERQLEDFMRSVRPISFK